MRELDYILRFSGSRPSSAPPPSEASTTSAMARQLRDGIPALTHVVVAGEPADGEWNLEHGIATTAAARRRASACA